jgi:ssDNA-specific exonuclease RecJ
MSKIPELTKEQWKKIYCTTMSEEYFEWLYNTLNDNEHGDINLNMTAIACQLKIMPKIIGE